jgi:hypothetical protein
LLSFHVMSCNVTYQHYIDPTVISWEERQSRTVTEAGTESVRTGTPVPVAGSFCGTTVQVLLKYNPYQRLINPLLVLSAKWLMNPRRLTLTLTLTLRALLLGVASVPFVVVPRPSLDRQRHRKRIGQLGHPVTEEAGEDLLRNLDVAAWKDHSACYYDRDHRRRMEASPEGGEVAGRRKIRIREGAVHYCLL